jgi:hypothetical protein
MALGMLVLSTAVCTDARPQVGLGSAVVNGRPCLPRVRQRDGVVPLQRRNARANALVSA